MGAKSGDGRNSVKVKRKTNSRFEFEILGYSIYIIHRKEKTFAILIISIREEVVLAETGDYENIDEACRSAVAKCFSTSVTY